MVVCPTPARRAASRIRSRPARYSSTSETFPQKQLLSFAHPVFTPNVIFLSALLGAYQFVRDANGAVDPTQFSYVENENPISFFDFFYAIPHGIVESANIIVSIMVISGVLYVIEQTGAIAAGLQRLTVVAKGKEIVVVLFLTFIFGILGVIGWGEDALPFIPMVASLALALGYDRIVGVGIVQLGVCIGFTTGAFNIFTTGICQELAGISIFSAWGFRLIEFLVCFVVLSLFLISYCRKIKRAPSKSVMPNFLEEQQQEQKIMSERVPMTARRIATLVVLLLAFVGQAVARYSSGTSADCISSWRWSWPSSTASTPARSAWTSSRAPPP